MSFAPLLLDVPFNAVAVLRTIEGNFYKIGPISEDEIASTVTFEWQFLFSDPPPSPTPTPTPGPGSVPLLTPESVVTCDATSATTVLLDTDGLLHPPGPTNLGEVSGYICPTDFTAATSLDSHITFDGTLGDIGTELIESGNVRFTVPWLKFDPPAFGMLQRLDLGSLSVNPPVLQPQSGASEIAPLVIEFSEGTGAVGFRVIGGVGGDRSMFVIVEDFAGNGRVIFIRRALGEGAFIGFDSPAGIKSIRLSDSTIVGDHWLAIDDLHYEAGNPFPG